MSKTNLGVMASMFASGVTSIEYQIKQVLWKPATTVSSITTVGEVYHCHQRHNVSIALVGVVFIPPVTRVRHVVV